MMPDPVAQLEIYGDDPEQLAGFYRSLFGWTIDEVSGMDDWMIVAVPTCSPCGRTIPTPGSPGATHVVR
jgi:predicted enzyme related to lactoylglutathione lyase